MPLMSRVLISRQQVGPSRSSVLHNNDIDSVRVYSVRQEGLVFLPNFMHLPIRGRQKFFDIHLIRRRMLTIQTERGAP